MSAAAEISSATAGDASPNAVTLDLCVELLTGRCVAAAGDDRTAAEWPPHPGRLFMALAAACFETDADSAARDALDWLAGLAPPAVLASAMSERTAVQAYVPVNDANRVQSGTLQSAPGLPRGRQDRYFPTAVPHVPRLVYRWAGVDAAAAARHFIGVRDVAAEVIRLGHSSSLVRVEAVRHDGGPGAESAAGLETWAPTGGLAARHLRVPSRGDLDRLEAAYGEAEVERFVELKQAVEESSGREKTAAKRAFEASVGKPYKASLTARIPVPARVGRSIGYALQAADADLNEAIANRFFSPQLHVLSPVDGARFNIEETLAMTRALRSAAMKAAPTTPPPAWLSGHGPGGGAVNDPHLAFLPLPFVGGRHGDGHLLGLAIAVPLGLDLAEVGRHLGPLLVDPQTGEIRDVKLTFGRRGDWTLRLESRPNPPAALSSDSWTKPHHRWASVTPVVLDRFPKADLAADRVGWTREVCAIVAQSCTRAGLPEPVAVDIDTTAWHRGSPRATPKRRRGGGPLGGGFPRLPSKPGRPPRPQVHVWLAFDRPVGGPMFLGAGRFAGYGFCKPWARRG